MKLIRICLLHYQFVEMIRKHWFLKTDNQAIKQTGKQGKFKFKFWRINNSHYTYPKRQNYNYIMKKTFPEATFSIFILLNQS